VRNSKDYTIVGEKMSNIESNNVPSTDDEIESYIEENVCGLCRKVSKAPIKENSQYFKMPTKCKEGSICAAAVFLEAMMRDEMHNNSNTVVSMIMKMVKIENS
jgi:hypothetical protein